MLGIGIVLGCLLVNILLAQTLLRHLLRQQKRHLQFIVVSACIYWQGYLDLNQEMTESESVALPFGYTPN